MSTQLVTHEIDFNFRPKSYWGTAEERLAKRLGTYDGIFMGWATRSGFDLPTLLPTEVEMARLRLAETGHQEVTSIRARRVGRRIAYRIVDEELSSEGYRFVFRPRSSSIPLTLGKLIEMIDNVEVFGPDGEAFPKGLVIAAWEHQVNECENSDPESLRNWMAVSSEYYPDLKAYYQQVFVQWALAKELI